MKDFSNRQQVVESTQTGEKVRYYAELVQRAQAGDRSAFDLLMEGRRTSLVNLAKSRLHDEHLADELVNVALLQAWQKIGCLKDPKAFAFWLRRIVWNMATNRVSQQRLARLASLETNDEPTSKGYGEIAAGGMSALIDDERWAVLRKAMDGLSHEDRQAIELYYFDHLQDKDAVKIARCNRNTLKRRRCIALQRLYGMLAQQEDIFKD